jgi:hypothetical protein
MGLINKILSEQAPVTGSTTNSMTGNDRIANIATTLQSVQTKSIPTLVIVNPNSKNNNRPWSDYVKMFKVTQQEINQAKALISKMGGKVPTIPTQDAAPNPIPTPKPTNAPSPRDIRATKMAQMNQQTGGGAQPQKK